MTAGGYSALEEELKRRQQIERPRIIQAIAGSAYARRFVRKCGVSRRQGGAVLERRAHSRTRGQIVACRGYRRLETLWKHDQIRRDGNARRRGHGRKKIYQIVGESEADVKAGRVSITSPTARALIGKKTGDSVEVNTPGGGKSYEIVNVAFQ